MAYDQAGAKNNAWKGDEAGYSARHKRRDNKTGNRKKGSKCAWCGSKKNLQNAEVHGEKGKFITLCASCHAKYDKKYKNLTKKSLAHDILIRLFELYK